MQLSHLQRLVGEVDAGDAGPARSHALGEYAATAADVQHALAAQAGEIVDVVQPQRVDVVQRLEFGARIPPTVRKLAEFLELERIDVNHGLWRSAFGDQLTS